MEAIKTIDLKVGYDEHIVVPDFNADFIKGKITSIIGPNGCGKSTVLKANGRIIRKEAGTVIINDNDIQNLKSKEIAKMVSILPQSPNAPSSITCFDLVAYGRYPYQKGFGRLTKEDKDIINWALEVTNMKEFSSRPIAFLSGGQKQRVWIAMALAQQTDIILLDEPTTGLDPQTRKNVWELIDELRKKEKLTVLLTTHYMEEASKSDYVVIIDKGVIVAEGKPSDLKTKFAYDYLKIYNYNEDLKGLLIKNNIKYSLESNCLEIKFQSTKEAKDFVSDYKDYIYDLEIIKGTMDDVFLNATGKELNNL